jgi:2-dehydro-3-deoxy-D-gluconate 5-dehydrogenase
MSTELFSLQGRVALVTGGNSGIGRALALGFRTAGAQVVVTGRNPDKNRAMAAELGDEHTVIALDVRKEDTVSRAIGMVAARFGRLDILVNNAGLFRGGSVLELSLDDWNAVLDTHLTGAFLCSKYAAQLMQGQGTGGKIINIGSMYSVFGPPRAPDYTSAKAGVLGLTRALAVELAE